LWGKKRTEKPLEDRLGPNQKTLPEKPHGIQKCGPVYSPVTVLKKKFPKAQRTFSL